MEFINLILMMADAATKICTDGNLRGIFGIVGWVVNIVKIATPIILIVVGMLDMAKAIMGKNEDAIKDAQGLLVKKAIAAVAVFLVITLVVFVFQVIVGYTWPSASSNCVKCIDNPTNCTIE